MGTGAPLGSNILQLRPTLPMNSAQSSNASSSANNKDYKVSPRRQSHLHPQGLNVKVNGMGSGFDGNDADDSPGIGNKNVKIKSGIGPSSSSHLGQGTGNSGPTSNS